MQRPCGRWNIPFLSINFSFFSRAHWFMTISSLLTKTLLYIISCNLVWFRGINTCICYRFVTTDCSADVNLDGCHQIVKHPPEVMVCLKVVMLDTAFKIASYSFSFEDHEWDFFFALLGVIVAIAVVVCVLIGVLLIGLAVFFYKRRNSTPHSSR